MQFTAILGRPARTMLAALLFLAVIPLARGTDTYDGTNLSIPSLAVGSASWGNVVLKPGAILGIYGGGVNAIADTYDPARNELAIPAVTYLGKVYTNVLVKVASLGSIGFVEGVDTYDGVHLNIPSVQVGGRIYSNVVVSVGNILSTGGGMPTNIRDVYDGASGQLTIAAIQLGSKVFTNAVVTVAKVVSFGAVGIAVPDVVGDTQAAATAAISGAGLTVGTVSAQPSATVAYGLVISESPTALSSVASGAAVSLILSSGPAPTESVLYSFTGNGGISASTDGAQPRASLVIGADGSLYGTTEVGGAFHDGAVVRITPAGVETVLHAFSGTNGISGMPDGAQPEAGLMLAANGSLYGTTYSGGANNQGSVYSISPTGTAALVYSFKGTGGLSGAQDGAAPRAVLVEDSQGNLYGTTVGGGKHGAGTVFVITSGGVESVLYSFANGTDGAYPYAGLTAGSDGNFYGTTASGGAYGQGTVFSITPAGVETVLHSFSGNNGLSGSNDGAQPNAALVQGSDGTLYGVTNFGGAYDEGAVFSISTTGTLTVLHDFSGNGGIYGSTDGGRPYGGLIQRSDGNFYGATFYGGTHGRGAVFSVTPGGVESVIYSFSGNGGIQGSTDGSQPYTGLLQGSGGTLYGVTYYGGTYDVGSVFSLAFTP